MTTTTITFPAVDGLRSFTTPRPFTETVSSRVFTTKIFLALIGCNLDPKTGCILSTINRIAYQSRETILSMGLKYRNTVVQKYDLDHVLHAQKLFFPSAEASKIQRAIRWNAGVQILAPKLAHIPDLDLEDSHATSATVAMVVRHAISLRILDLTNCSLEPTPDFTKALSTRASQLESLSFNCCTKLDSNVVGAIARLANNLTNLQVTATNINNDTITAIFSGCPKLRILNISFCKKITDFPIASITSSIPALVNLSCSDCPRINGIALRTLAVRQSTWETLDISDCQVDDADILALAGICNKLTHITLFEDQGIAMSEARRTLQMTHPNLTFELISRM